MDATTAMASYASVRLRELVEHMDELLRPSSTVNLIPDRFYDVRMCVTEDNASSISGVVMTKLITLLTSPAISRGEGALANTEAVCLLIRKLLQQPSFSFDDAMAIAPKEALIDSMSPYATPETNKLAIAIIEKAVGPRTSPDWGPTSKEINNMISLVDEDRFLGLFSEFVKCWLLNPDIGVGEYSERVLLRLLDADWPRDGLRMPVTRNSNDSASTSRSESSTQSLLLERPFGIGQLWYCLFKDSELYDNTIVRYAETTVDHFHYEEIVESSDEDGPDAQIRTSRSRSTAQSRILSILPQLAALNFQFIADSSCGLLDYAIGDMINKNDLLMFGQMQLFYRDLVVCTRCLLDQSDIRSGITRAQRPHYASGNDIEDRRLKKEVTIMREIMQHASSIDWRLVPIGDMIVAERQQAAQNGQCTQEEADDMRQWVELVLPREDHPSLPLR